MIGQLAGYIRLRNVGWDPERLLDQVSAYRIFADKASGNNTSCPQLTDLDAFAHEGDTLVVKARLLDQC